MIKTAVGTQGPQRVIWGFLLLGFKWRSLVIGDVVWIVLFFDQQA